MEHVKAQGRALNKNINLIIGQLIKRRRKAAKITQTQICAALGLDQSALSRVESGKQHVTAAQWTLFNQTVGIKSDSLTKLVQRQIRLIVL